MILQVAAAISSRFPGATDTKSLATLKDLEALKGLPWAWEMANKNPWRMWIYPKKHAEHVDLTGENGNLTGKNW